MPQGMAAPAFPTPPRIGPTQNAGGMGGSGVGDMFKQGMQYAIADQVMGQMMPSLPPFPPMPGATPTTAAMSTPAPVSTASPSRAASTVSSTPDATSHQAWIKSMYPIAKAWSAKTGIPADILLAINLNESNFGQMAGNSLFGVKGSGGAGSINSPTWESVNGQHVNTTADFAAYGSPDAAYQSFWNLVSTSPRYKTALAAIQRGDVDGFLQELVKNGYATDPAWGTHIQDVARTTVDPMLQGGQ